MSLILVLKKLGWKGVAPISAEEEANTKRKYKFSFVTMAFDSSYVIPMIVGKLVSGICAVFLALFIYKGDTPQREDERNRKAGQ